MGGFSLPFSLAAPPNADLCCCGFFIFFGSDLMGGFGSGWFFSSVQPRCATRCRSLLLWVFFFFFAVILLVGSAVGGFSLPFSLAVPPDADLCCCGVFFFFG